VTYRISQWVHTSTVWPDVDGALLPNAFWSILGQQNTFQCIKTFKHLFVENVATRNINITFYMP